MGDSGLVGVHIRGVGSRDSPARDPREASGMLPVIEADEPISYCPIPLPPQQSGFHQVLELVTLIGLLHCCVE